jgi:hypothetical protein
VGCFLARGRNRLLRRQRYLGLFYPAADGADHAGGAQTARSADPVVATAEETQAAHAVFRIHHFERPFTACLGRQQEDGPEAFGRQLDGPVCIFVRGARRQFLAFFARELKSFVEAVLQLLKLAICFLDKLPCLIEDTGSVLHLALLRN